MKWITERVASFTARFSAFIRGARLGDHFLVLFVPYEKHGPADAVEAIGRALQARLSRPPASIWLSSKLPSIQEAAQRAGLTAPPVRVVLFAHPNAAENGFLVNATDDQASDLFTGWWSVPEHQYEFVYANVCNGASILDREPWAAVFPRWVSYNRRVEAFLATDRARSLWVDLGSRLIDACWESENVDSLHYRLQSAYHDTLAHLHDTLDESGGDAITMAFMAKALKSLEMRAA
jgi:hypothetical protein